MRGVTVGESNVALYY